MHLLIIFILLSSFIFSQEKTEMLSSINKSYNLLLRETHESRFLTPLSVDFLKSIKELFNANTFVETGTFLGYTTANAAKVFDYVHTIELSKELYEKAGNSLKNYSNVILHLGDSANVLPKLLPLLGGKTVFWLDGHYSGLHAGEQTAIGEETTPILKEITCIQQSIKDAIILVDDIRLFDSTLKLDSNNEFYGNEAPIVLGGYPSLNKVRDLIYKNNQNYKVAVIGDVLLAYPNSSDILPSPIVEACTISRFADELTDYVLNAEKTIAQSEGSEKIFLEKLYQNSANHKLGWGYGIGKHYILWKGLIALNGNDGAEAYDRFKSLDNLQVDNWRIKWYLAQAAFLLHRISETEELLNYVLSRVPGFQDAKELQKLMKK